MTSFVNTMTTAESTVLQLHIDILVCIYSTCILLRVVVTNDYLSHCCLSMVKPTLTPDINKVFPPHRQWDVLSHKVDSECTSK